MAKSLIWAIVEKKNHTGMSPETQKMSGKLRNFSLKKKPFIHVSQVKNTFQKVAISMLANQNSLH